MRILLLLTGVVVLSGQVLATEIAEMSASEVIKKSESAYAAVKTYVGTTTVRGKSDIEGTKLEQVSTANVTFMRPGKVRIEGRTASHDASGKGGNLFTIVSDGKTTWRSWAIRNNGAFEEVKNVQMAGMSGVAQGAAEGIPAALMKSDGAWTGGSDPFIVPRLTGAKVEGHEKTDGADCYKLVSSNPTLGDISLWIDSKTFLLRQMTRELNETQLAKQTESVEAALKKLGKELPAKTPRVKSMSTVFSFTTDKVDEPVDEKLFADPTKKE